MSVKPEKVKTKYLEEEIEFMGIKVNPNSLTNVHLKKIVIDMNESDYRLRYDDHERTRWTDEPWREKYHETYKEYAKYADYDDAYRDQASPGGGFWRDKHSDYQCYASD